MCISNVCHIYVTSIKLDTWCDNYPLKIKQNRTMFNHSQDVTLYYNTLKEEVEACESPERDNIDPCLEMSPLPIPLSIMYFWNIKWIKYRAYNKMVAIYQQMLK